MSNSSTLQTTLPHVVEQGSSGLPEAVETELDEKRIEGERKVPVPARFTLVSEPGLGERPIERGEAESTLLGKAATKLRRL